MTARVGEIYKGRQDPLMIITILARELHDRTIEQDHKTDNLLKLAKNTIAHDLDNKERVQETVDALQEALQRFAPAFTYFGSHPDDPTRLGYWPDWPTILDLPVVYNENDAKGRTGWVRLVPDGFGHEQLWQNGKKEVDL